MTTLVCSAVSSWFRSFWTFAGQNFGAAGRFDRQGRVGFRPRRKHFPISSKTTGVLCSPVRRNVMCATQLKEAGFTTSNVDSAGLFLHQLRKWAPLKRRMAFQTYRTPPRPPARTHAPWRCDDLEPESVSRGGRPVHELETCVCSTEAMIDIIQ